MFSYCRFIVMFYVFTIFSAGKHDADDGLTLSGSVLAYGVAK